MAELIKRLSQHTEMSGAATATLCSIGYGEGIIPQQLPIPLYMRLRLLCRVTHKLTAIRPKMIFPDYPCITQQNSKQSPRQQYRGLIVAAERSCGIELRIRLEVDSSSSSRDFSAASFLHLLEMVEKIKEDSDDLHAISCGILR
ncbi:hypothetical protein TSAR_010654 [Trichomalopsis sarcophagae]|uniref:Uncharacterized protein n=1 Tax=Trichomalopsis sarcophagae TaxID=543379 RepID=A0A232FF25_9HYME|nr:hypothetical protein TSAR_010654 [Trichomalopsis sarcophagae]